MKPTKKEIKSRINDLAADIVGLPMNENLKEIAAAQIQKSLFDNIDLEQLSPAYNCKCTS